LPFIAPPAAVSVAQQWRYWFEMERGCFIRGAQASLNDSVLEVV